MKIAKVIFWFGTLLLPLLLSGQILPPIEIYTAEQYGGQNQNWAISQASDNFIYFANSEGLLEFNGSIWKLYPSPNETTLRSVKAINDKIYTGCYMEFGVWEKTKFGNLAYKSLSKELKSPLKEDEHFWNILSLDDWILFQSLNRIYIYNTKAKTFEVIESETRLTKVFKAEDTIYFQKLNDGIYKLENGKETLVSDDSIVKENTIVDIFIHNNKLLFLTEDKGFYFYDEGSVSKWIMSSNKLLESVRVYNSIQLTDDSFVLGTISNGLIHITVNGDLNYQISQNEGLSNNTILNLFEDKNGNIWLGLDNGINCINKRSPYGVFKDINGKLGTIYTSIVYKDKLYLGTNQGLFSKNLNKDVNFELVDGVKGQVWSLTIIDNVLFCGHDNGTFIIDNEKAEKISEIQGTWSIKSIPGNKNLLLQGNYLGLYVLEKKGTSWVYRNKIDGLDISSRYFEFLNDTEILLNHEYKGVFKIKFDKDYLKIVEFVQDESIEKGLHSSLIKHDDRILYSFRNGVFEFNKEGNVFERDSIFSEIYENENFISGKLVVDNTNKIWGFTGKNINYISPGKLSSTPQINRIPITNSLRKGNTGFENISHIGTDKFLLGSSTGFFIIDLNKHINKPVDIAINLIYKSGINKPTATVNKSISGDFINKENNVEFFFSVVEFEKYVESQYQYQLEGLYNNWSNWSSKPSVLFENLPFGDYIFNVRGKLGNNISTNVATYSFRIARPWFLSNIAIALYVLGLLVFSIITHNIYKAYYKKQREKLLNKTQRELELRKFENTQQLMQFNNANLRQDIDNKNRELGISTMSLIKKNEFLNTLKKELKIADSSNNLKHIIKIIDRNLNNTDDWQVFEEAFNSADKDFLKKVKQNHPALTSNDLRLCAYLRLNLSSKEIAPLLNISSRSVEVKRYRLRKKIGLQRESSLTDYILEI